MGITVSKNGNIFFDLKMSKIFFLMIQLTKFVFTIAEKKTECG